MSGAGTGVLTAMCRMMREGYVPGRLCETWPVETHLNT